MPASRSVMIVDDSRVVLRMMKEKVRRQGVDPRKIHTATSGEEAVALFPVVQPDLVFLDVHLEGIDGEVTSRELLEEDPETHVVVITGYGADDERVKRMVSGGAFEVLEKPIHTRQLEDVLNLVEREETGAGRIR